MRDLLLRAQGWLHSLGYRMGLDDGTGHRPVTTPAGPGLPDGMSELGRVEQLHLREPGDVEVTALVFEPGELRAWLRGDDARHPGRKTLELVGRVDAKVLDHLHVDAGRRAQIPILLGPLHRVVYSQGPPEAETRWEHAFGYEFGSDGSELPLLFYYPGPGRLVVLGGVYWVGIRSGICN
jgi:hypothetical protein